MNEPLLFEVHTFRDISAKTHESLDIYQIFLKIWKHLNCPRGDKTKTMSFFFRFDYPSAIIFVRMRLISVWIINTVNKARAVINMNIIIYELAML